MPPRRGGDDVRGQRRRCARWLTCGTVVYFDVDINTLPASAGPEASTRARAVHRRLGAAVRTRPSGALRESPSVALDYRSIGQPTGTAGPGGLPAVVNAIKVNDTPAAVGDGAVGLCAVLSAGKLGASRIVALSRNPYRQALAIGVRCH